MKTIFIMTIKAYQKTLSPMFGERCKYFPSCSHYAVDALTEKGVVRGLPLIAWRLIRCNPWSHGGADYISTADKSSTRNLNTTNAPQTLAGAR